VENVIEVRYAGVVVGRSTKVRDWNDAGAFIGFAEPLPSGTSLVLKGDGVEQPARVVEVIESAEPGAAGMLVTFADAARAVRSAPRPAATPPKAAPAAPSLAPVAAPAAAPPVAEAPAAAASIAAAAPTTVAEAAPVELSAGTSSAAVTGEASGPATGEHAEGEAGQGGGGGKRRRRRR
jgi:hypothetical protein